MERAALADPSQLRRFHEASEASGLVDRDYAQARRLEGLLGHALAKVGNHPAAPARRVRKLVQGVIDEKAEVSVNYVTLDSFTRCNSAIYALCARLDGQVHVGVRVTSVWSKKATPGTAWSTWSPWRERQSPKTIARRTRTWLKQRMGYAPDLSCSLRVARLWLALEEWCPPPSDAPAPVPITEKQLSRIKTLCCRYRIKPAALEDLLLKAGGTRDLERLKKHTAAKVINDLVVQQLVV